MSERVGMLVGMEPIKRIGGAHNVREHRMDAALRSVDVRLASDPSQEWWHAFENAPGRALHMIDLEGDTITFTVESEAEIAATLSEIDRRIEMANRSAR